MLGLRATSNSGFSAAISPLQGSEHCSLLSRGGALRSAQRLPLATIFRAVGAQNAIGLLRLRRSLCGKPILDMMAGVAQFEKALLCKAPLEAMGYDYLADADIANDYVFGKGVARTHYLHVVEYGGAKWTDHLCFRDRLRNDPELARAYEKLKEELRLKFSDSRAKYHEAKKKFISDVVAAQQ
jgi:hypothetical protein